MFNWLKNINWRKVGKATKPVGIGLTILGTLIGLGSELVDLTDSIKQAKEEPELTGPTKES